MKSKLCISFILFSISLTLTGCPPPHQHIDYLVNNKRHERITLKNRTEDIKLKLSSYSGSPCNPYYVSVIIEVEQLKIKESIAINPLEMELYIGNRNIKRDDFHEFGDLDSNNYQVEIFFQSDGEVEEERVDGLLPITIKFNSLLMVDGQPVRFEPVQAVETKKCWHYN